MAHLAGANYVGYISTGKGYQELYYFWQEKENQLEKTGKAKGAQNVSKQRNALEVVDPNPKQFQVSYLDKSSKSQEENDCAENHL